MRGDFWNVVCGWARAWYAIAVMGSILLVLIAFSLPFASRSSGAYYVNFFSLAILLPTMAAIVLLLVHCRRIKR